MTGTGDRMTGSEGAAYYERLRRERGQDRAASLPRTMGEVLRSIESASRFLQSLVPPEANSREPAAPSGPSAPRNAAAEAPDSPVTSPLAARVLTALMQMPDAEFLAMANKVLNRYYAAVAALAPDGHTVQIECIHCGKPGTHRVCDACFPKDYDG